MVDQIGVVLDEATRRAAGAALARIPSSIYLMTAAHGRVSSGVLVSLVQQVAFEPPMVMVALAKGRFIVPVLHNAHCFALNEVAADDRVLLRRFSQRVDDEDPLASYRLADSVTGAPVLERAVSYLDCELIRHVDIESDHDVYVGLIRGAGVRDAAPAARPRLRDSGFEY